MKRTAKIVAVLVCAGFWGSSCNAVGKTAPVDAQATAETKALYVNLKILSGEKVLFGHQDATAYGVDRNHADSSYCDVRDVSGSYPAVYGWDIGHILESANVDDVVFKKMKRLIREAYARGGVITISWHEPNPVGKGRVNDLTPAVRRLLPGADYHAEWRHRLTVVGAFIKDLQDDHGRPIPVIFRPYHEHNGDWFWWGTKACSESEYVQLWRFTVEFLRDSLGVHQLLYAISPDRSRMDPRHLEKGILYAYPGDEYVDILGMDNYWDVGAVENYESDVPRSRQDSLFIQSLTELVRIAEQKGKIPALTETGCNALTETNWYGDRILKPLHAHLDMRKIAYLLVWRNASTGHFYVPYPGHPASADFIRFKQDELILFEDELPDMYRRASERLE